MTGEKTQKQSKRISNQAVNNESDPIGMIGKVPSRCPLQGTSSSKSFPRMDHELGGTMLGPHWASSLIERWLGGSYLD
jgi:hypothetical protein